MKRVSKSPVRIIIADDHELMRQGILNIFKDNGHIKIAGEAGDGVELIELAAKLKPDIIITDIQMPKMDGIEATKIMKKKYPEICIIALTVFQDEYQIIKMLEAGAQGYLTKNSAKEELPEAVEAVRNNKTYYCRDTTARLARLIARSKSDLPAKTKPVFNKAEMDIMRMICEEKPNKEIATAVNLNIRTVEGYRNRIEKKINVKNTAGIVVYAIRAGIYKINYDL